MSSDILNQHLVGNGSNTQFTLLTSVANTSSLLVSINGLLSDPDIDYSVASNLITFTYAPYSTSVIEIRYLPSFTIGYTGSAGSPGGYQGSVGFSGSYGFTGSAGAGGKDGYIGSFGYTGSKGYTGSIGSLGTPSDIQTIITDGTATYLLNKTPNNSKSILVAVNGLLQVPDVDYIVSGSNIVFNNIPPTGSDVEIIYFGNEVGYRGSSGFMGSAGYTGSIGTSGQDGYTGSRGFTGSSGIGYVGSRGYTGSSAVAAPSEFQTLTSNSDSTYSLTRIVTNSKDILVSVNGLLQVPETDYSVVGSTLSFITQPPVNSDVEILYFDVAGYIGSQGYMGSIGYKGSVGSPGYKGSAGIAEVYISPTTPQVPLLKGELWWDNESGVLSIYYDDDQTWVAIGDSFQGPPGYTGSQGNDGIIGYNGSSGINGYTGSAGANASVIITSGVIPTGPYSKGQLWWDSQSGILSIYYDVQNTWVAVDNAQQGYTGSAGTGSGGGNGYTGSHGIQGYTGSLGGNGYNGSIGIQGYSGSIGVGIQGYTGSIGIQGYTGSAGSGGGSGNGYTGSAGYTGSIGFKGSNGYTGSQGVGYTGSQGIGYTGSSGLQGYTGSAGSGGSSSFINIYGSSVAYPVNTRLSQTISVKDYGAKGDGATDDAAAIRLAIAAAKTVVQNGTSGYKKLNATVYFPAGVYNVGSTINIDSDCISFQGAGKNATQIQGTFSSGDLFYVYAGLHQPINLINMSDFAITSSVSKTSGAFIHLINSHDCFFENLELWSYSGMWDGIVIDGDPWTTSSGYSPWQPYTNKFHWVNIGGGGGIGNAGFNIGPNGYPQDTWIDDCEINGTPYGIIYKCGGGLQVMRTGCLNNTTGMVISPGSGKECTWTWLHMLQVDTGSGDGLVIKPDSGGVVKVVNITTGWFSSMAGNGVLIDKNSGPGQTLCDITLNATTCLNNTKNGISTNGSIDNLMINNCNILNNSSQSSGTYHGVYIGQNANRVNINSNRIGSSQSNSNNNQGYGVFIDLNVQNVIIQSNILNGNVNGNISDNVPGSGRAIGNNL